jgi:ribonuclease BN (tRNA processing enzyme)
MKVRVLGCSGAIAKGCRTTSFLVADSILIDAGTGVGDLTLEEMRKVEHVFLTHSHLDHILSLPLMLDATSSMRTAPVQVHALPHTLEALQTHVFNNTIWPDFSVLPSKAAPFLKYCPMAIGETRLTNGIAVEALSASHSVPAVGFAVQGSTGWWVFSGDTEHNAAFWQRVNALPVAQLIIETTFSDQEHGLAHRSLHLSPRALLKELAQITPSGARYPIYITHTKPSETLRIMQEVEKWRNEQQEASGSPHPLDIRWLETGQILEA